MERSIAGDVGEDSIIAASSRVLTRERVEARKMTPNIGVHEVLEKVFSVWFLFVNCK